MTINYKRHIKYIDRYLQGRLITTLMVIEALIVTVSMIYLYYDYSALLEDYIYSIHRVADEDLFLHMMKHLIIVVSCMTMMNIVLLMLANSLWVRHIRRILSCFTSRLRAIRSLDLRQKEPCGVHHEVLDTLENWRGRESLRYNKLSSQLEGLMEGSTEKRLRAIHEALEILPLNKP